MNFRTEGRRQQKAVSTRLGNFADPLGLIYRMISQGGPIGWSLLAMEVVSRCARPVDFAMQLLERKQWEQAAQTKLPTVLITGPPRSGTTLAHQLLQQHLDVSYFSNLNGLFPKSAVTSAKWFGAATNPPRSEFRSLYGNSPGLRGPSDGFHVWDRFLGHDRYRVDEELLEDQVKKLHQFINAWSEVTGKPLISKNNRNSLAMKHLADHLPGARFVVIKRDPFFIAQSLLHAREWVQGDVSRPWGLCSEEVTADDGPIDEMSIADAVCDQVTAIMDCIDSQLREVDPQRQCVFDYEQVCENPVGFVREVAERWDVGLRPGRNLEELEPLRPSDEITVDQKIADRIRDRLQSSELALRDAH